MSSSRAALLVVLFAASANASYVPKANTRHQIKKYVQAAAKHIAQHGPSCSEFAKQEWRDGDYYIFVIGPDLRTLCHANPAMIGRAERDIVDANGKRVGDMIVAAAKKFRGGWVDYVWPRPGSNKPVPKSTYAQRVKSPDGDTYIVGSGGYGLK
jgi:signal transduction histidine kinase